MAALQSVTSVVFGPMTPILLLIATTFFLRWYDGKYGLGIGVDVRPTASQLDPPIPAFCDGLETSPLARSNIFYYDLGGTYCACEKQWNVQEYWGKTFSGLAFNLPHFIDLIAACLVYGDLRFACFLIFLNEWIEEMVVAVSPHWGFNADPYTDLEPRYDTLMRDVIHGFMGMWLAASVMHVTACKGYSDLAGALMRPLFDTAAARRGARGRREERGAAGKISQGASDSRDDTEMTNAPAQIDVEVACGAQEAAGTRGSSDGGVDDAFGLVPLRWQDWVSVFTAEGNRACAADPSSPIRLLRMHLCFFGCWRQMFMLYNLDAGIRAFSFQNVCLSALVAVWYALMFRLNRSHMPAVPVRRLAVQHVVPAIICAGACLACVYPPMPTIYLIMMIEGASKMALTLFELSLLAFPAITAALQLDAEEDPVDARAFLRAARVPGMPIHTLLAELLASTSDPVQATRTQVRADKRGAEAADGSEQCGGPPEASGPPSRGGSDGRATMEGSDGRATMEGGPRGERELDAVEARVQAVLERLKLQARGESSGGRSIVQRLGAGGVLRVSFNFSFSLFLIVMAAIQPLSYEGTKSLTGATVSVQYARHWCGNPKGVQYKKNTCLSAGNATGH